MTCLHCMNQPRSVGTTPGDTFEPMTDFRAQDHYNLPNAEGWWVCKECDRPWKYDEQLGWQAPNM